MRLWRIAAVVISAWLATSLSAAAQPAPPYVLSADELAALRAGKDLRRQMYRTMPVGRVIAHIADKRGGRYSGNNWSVQRTFYEFMGVPREMTEPDERYLVAAGCRPHSCPEKAALIVDLKTGHVAFAFLSSSTTTGRDLKSNPGLTRFMKSCVDRDFRAFAEKRFIDWAEEELEVHTKAAPGLDKKEVRTLTTRC